MKNKIWTFLIWVIVLIQATLLILTIAREREMDKLEEQIKIMQERQL